MSLVGKNERTIIERAEGVYVYDTDGNRLLDAPAGMWCQQIGHGREEMADAIHEQVMRMTYASPWGLGTAPAALLAEKIGEISPGDLNQVFFSTGGSEAVDSALRFVMFYFNNIGKPDKKHIISRQKAYHGTTYLCSSVSGKERDKSWFDFETGFIHHISDPNPYRRPDDMSVEEFCDFLVEELENKIKELGPDKVAAFIAEPVLGAGGVSVPPEGYHRRTWEVCKSYDVLYISDEVVTAFGRLGHWFASKDVFDIEPDIITVAKGITSGYLPMGATLISDRLMNRISGSEENDSVFSCGYTYSGHPVVCAAALKNIEIMERENLLEHVREVGPYMQERLQELNDIEIVGNVRGKGLMGCVECVISKDSRDPLTMDYEIGNRIDRHCQALGGGRRARGPVEPPGAEPRRPQRGMSGSPADPGAVRTERDGPVAVLILDRPDKLNAITPAMAEALHDALDAAEADEAVRAIVVAGEGRAFSAGFDLEAGEWDSLEKIRCEMQADFDLILRFWASPKPTVAALHGPCLGGALELALACDLTVAEEDCRLGEPEVRFGSGIVAMLLPWVTGPKQAKELLLTGDDRVSAQRAYDMGLVNRVAVRLTKLAVNRSYEAMGLRRALDQALELGIEAEASETPASKAFNEILAKDGAKAALAWRARQA
jgi:adenosylmethionine-8-amino-7-oxononanoate aminotransferase/enoyl-CoA hydratase/carnithine racemase